MFKIILKNIPRIHSILWVIFTIFSISCSALPEHSNSNGSINAIRPVINEDYESYFKTRENHQVYDINDAAAYTLDTHPEKLIHARQLAYKNILANRLAKYSIKEYYLNGNGVVFITELPSIDTLRFREFIRSGFCPIVGDLAQGFKNNRRVIMLNSKARQGRYVDYTFDLCRQIDKMSIKDSNRLLFPKIQAF